MTDFVGNEIYIGAKVVTSWDAGGNQALIIANVVKCCERKVKLSLGKDVGCILRYPANLLVLND